jgi:acetoin utilization protein AcuC
VTTPGPACAGRVVLLWDDQLAGYNLGPGHPLAPVRVELTVELIRASGLLDAPDTAEVLPGPFDEAELLRLHRPDFVAAVKQASAQPDARIDARFGLGPGDTPAFAGMHPASMLVCAATKEAARQVWEGEAIHSFSPAGGLHHAMPASAAGFCVYNDPAMAIDWLLEHGAERICYVDVDVHHGDGVELMFANDPRVLTISLHESGRYLFPGTGDVDDIGGPDAQGSAANLPLAPGTTGDVWLEAFDAVVDPLVRAFAPDVLVTQLGCDTHATDPLAHLALTVDDMAEIYARLHVLAHDLCAGRWIATGGGGYQLVSVVPRAWTRAFAEMGRHTLPVQTPLGWHAVVEARTGTRAPASFRDERVRLPDHVLAQTREAARQAVEGLRGVLGPYHGL